MLINQGYLLVEDDSASCAFRTAPVSESLEHKKARLSRPDEPGPGIRINQGFFDQHMVLWRRQRTSPIADVSVVSPGR